MHIDGIQGIVVATKKRPKKTIAMKTVARVKKVITPKRTYTYGDILRNEWKKSQSEISFSEYQKERGHALQSNPSELLKRFK